MNYIDIIIVILVLLAAIKGFTRGLIKEIVSLISLVVGVYLAITFSVLFENYLLKTFPKHEEFVSIASFVFVFLIVFLSLKLAGIVISKLAKQLQLNFLNKLLGMLFGSVKALLIISIILFELQHLGETFGVGFPKKQIEKSLLYKPVVNLIPTISPIAKQKFKEIQEDYNFNDSTPE